jgi:hypothetical protein
MRVLGTEMPQMTFLKSSLYIRYIYIYLFIYLTAIGLTLGGSGTVHIYTQYTEYRERNIHNNKKLNTHNK